MVGEYSVGTKVFVVDDNSNSSWTQIRDEDYEYGEEILNFYKPYYKRYKREKYWYSPIDNSELGAEGAFKTFTLTFDAATATSTVKIATSSKRAYIDNVKIATAK
mgnify:CR=1 FL=1